MRELWTELPPGSKKGAKPIARDRIISKMFLRGDSVIIVVDGESLRKATEAPAQ